MGWGSRGRDGRCRCHPHPAVWVGCCAAVTMGVLDAVITDQTSLNFCHKKHLMLFTWGSHHGKYCFSQLIFDIKKS